MYMKLVVTSAAQARCGVAGSNDAFLFPTAACDAEMSSNYMAYHFHEAWSTRSET